MRRFRRGVCEEKRWRVHPVLLERSTQDLQRLLDHALGGLHSGGVELIGAHRAEQVGHFHHWIHIGIGHESRRIGVGVPGS